MDSFADALAQPTPTPGGGAAAARVGRYGCSLIRMVLGISLKRIDAAGPGARTAEALREADAKAKDLSDRLARLELEDMAAFDAYLAAVRLPRATPEEKAARDRARAQAALRATRAPLDMLESACEVLDLCARLVELSRTAPLRAESDLGAAIELARATFAAAELNVRVNLPALEASDAAWAREAWRSLSARFEGAYPALRAAVLASLGGSLGGGSAG